ncbi:MAG: o-succinylbenzoate synthase [Pseudomonadota bacterium]
MEKKTLNFNFSAKTSRSVLTQHDCYIISISKNNQPDIIGLGEASPLPGLSIDYDKDFESILEQYCHQLRSQTLHSSTITQFIPEQLPSLRFAFETALLDLEQGGKQQLFNSGFTSGTDSIPINGLIWMGELSFMQKQVEEKLQQGYHCIKIKVGSLDFEKEYQLVKSVRERHSAQELIIRLDANGAYSSSNALSMLKKWKKLNIHSIEQPIAAGQHNLMTKLCLSSPIAISLDEELIGVTKATDKMSLLQMIKPAYVILKPTLLGGFKATAEWIHLAQSLSIGWWITSALESNIGLNAIAQFVAQYQPVLHQGLGTGQLYDNNFSTKLTIKSGFMYCTF